MQSAFYYILKGKELKLEDFSVMDILNLIRVRFDSVDLVFVPR